MSHRPSKLLNAELTYLASLATPPTDVQLRASAMRAGVSVETLNARRRGR